MLAVQLRDVSFGSLFAHVQLGWLGLAFAAFTVSLGAAAHNISAFAPLRLRALDTMRAQLAVGALRIVAPAAVSTPAIGARFLTRSGLALPESLAVVATAQTAQLLMTVVVVGAIAAVGSAALPLPDARSAAIVARGAGRRARRSGAGGSPAAGRAAHAHASRRRDPVDRGSICGADRCACSPGSRPPARLTLAHVAAFACCVHAVGGHASVLALTAVYLGASSAGSLVPTPAGIGAVEAALISGLAATGHAGGDRDGSRAADPAGDGLGAGPAGLVGDALAAPRRPALTTDVSAAPAGLALAAARSPRSTSGAW